MSEEKRDLVEDYVSQQPTRTGRTRPPRRFDKTQLRGDHHGQYVHRDYLAHAFRWGWVGRHLDKGDRVLDVGCGQDLPLMHVLSGSKSTVPSAYVGVDLNHVEQPTSPRWAKVFGQFNFVDDYEKLGQVHHSLFDETEQLPPFDKAVCFEVCEHMSMEDGLRLLRGLHHWLREGGTLFFSTPVFNGMAAVNHVRERTVPEMQAQVEEAGFKVMARFGTFASANDLKRVAIAEHLAIWNNLQDYYGHDVLSTFLAPLYPDASRNNLWVLTK